MKHQLPKLNLSAILVASIIFIAAAIGQIQYFIYQGYQWAKERQVTQNQECRNLVRNLTSRDPARHADRARVKGCEEYVAELNSNLMSPSDLP